LSFFSTLFAFLTASYYFGAVFYVLIAPKGVY
jgi:hypothetical protein